MPPCKLFNYELIRNIFSCPRGGAFSAISCPSWWGICRFLRAIKTNPHLYPGLEWVGVYFDWCITVGVKIVQILCTNNKETIIFQRSFIIEYLIFELGCSNSEKSVKMRSKQQAYTHVVNST